MHFLIEKKKNYFKNMMVFGAIALSIEKENDSESINSNNKKN